MDHDDDDPICAHFTHAFTAVATSEVLFAMDPEQDDEELLSHNL